jgi:uncharacterized protein YlxW (UPF0749 family)
MKNLNKKLAFMFICIILGIAISVQYKSISRNNQFSKLEYATINELKDQVINQNKKINDLNNKNNEISSQLKEYENNYASRDTVINNLKNETEKAQILAGLVDVKGRGIVIKLTNDGLETVSYDSILAVLNELRVGDAQAISINDQRIVATSEVIDAGGYIIINGKQMLPPITIKAIANPDQIEHSIKMIGGLMEQLSKYYYVNAEFSKDNSILIPKVEDDVIKTNLLTPSN